MKPAIAVIALSLAFTVVAAAKAHEREPPDGMVGLVRLPMLFGEGACSHFQPKVVQLFSEPREASPLGQIRVTKQWVFAKEGGCSDLEVKVFLEAQSPEPLPTLEYEYEAPAAIVLTKSGRWCQIKLQSRSAWIGRECPSGFVSVQNLFRERILYLRRDALALAMHRPNGTAFKPPPTFLGAAEVSASLIASRVIGGKTWLHVSASYISSCERGSKPDEILRFWLPLRDTTGALQVWYRSRGC